MGDGRKKISTTVYITQEQNMRLKDLHELTRVPVAEYVREGIDLVLERYKHIVPGYRPKPSEDRENRRPFPLEVKVDEQDGSAIPTEI